MSTIPPVARTPFIPKPADAEDHYRAELSQALNISAEIAEGNGFQPPYVRQHNHIVSQLTN